MAKKSSPASLLPALTENKRYMKKMKFLEKRKEAAAAAAQRGGRNANAKKKNKKAVGVKGGKGKKKSAVSLAKKSPAEPVKKRGKIARGGSVKMNRKHNNKNNNLQKRNEDADSVTLPQQDEKQQPTQEEIDRQMIERAIRGEEFTNNASASQLSSGEVASAGADDLLQYPYLPFLEDYAKQKRGEVVSADTLLRNAHDYFKSLGKRESAVRRAAARRLREMKIINSRGGDKDGFRYVVPRNVKELVRQMTQNSAEAAGVDTAQLTSTFGGDDDVEDVAERPMHRKRRRKACYSDFYQFQVSKRWTRNAESFLNKSRAHKSMFEASRPGRSIKKF